MCSSEPQLDVAGGAHPREPRMAVISSPGGAGGVLQPPKPPPALRASKWEKILKSMSQFIPYFSVSSSGYSCKVQQTRDKDCRDSACLPWEELWKQHRGNCNFPALGGKKGEFRFLILQLTSFLMLTLKKIAQI